MYFGGEYWCDHCVNEYLSYCCVCDGITTLKTVYTVRKRVSGTATAVPKHLTRCSRCDDWFLNDSVTFCSSDGHDYCDSCMEYKDIQQCDSCGEYYDYALNDDMHCCHCAPEAVDNESEDTNE